MSTNTDEKAAEFLDPETMTSYELCDWLRSFIERLSGSIPVHEARNAWSAAAVLQKRHGSAAIGFKDPDAKRCAEAASRIEGYGAAAALMQAAHKIDDMARQHASQRLLDDLRKLAPSRDDIVEERDRLRADNERLTKELKVVNELNGNQTTLIRALRDCNAALDRQAAEVDGGAA